MYVFLVQLIIRDVTTLSSTKIEFSKFSFHGDVGNNMQCLEKLEKSTCIKQLGKRLSKNP